MNNQPTMPEQPAIPAQPATTRTPHIRLWIAGGIAALLLFLCCSASVPLAVYGSLLPATPTAAAGAPGAANTSHQQPTATAASATSTPATPQPTAQPTATPRPAPTATLPPLPAWHNDEAVSGNGDKTTVTFSVPFDSQAQLLWSCNPASSYGGQYNVIVSIYNSDGTIADYGTVNTICHTGNTHGSTALQGIDNWSGDEYLQILSEGSWTVKVQSYY